MQDLYVITLFNIKKIIKTWPIWFFSLLLLVLVSGSLFYLSDTKKVDLLLNLDDKSVDVSSIYNSTEFYKNYNINQIKEEKRRPQKNEIAITIKSTDENNSNIKFIYGENISKDIALENYFVATLQREEINAIITQSSEGIKEYQVENNVEEKNPSEILSFIVLFLTYGFTLLCGATITTSVASEKISKVSDLIIYRMNPVKLVYGKILALFAVIGIIICSLVVEIGVLVNFSSNIKKYIIHLLKNIDLSWRNILLIIIMSASAIVVYTLMYALVGMFVKDQQQLQFAQLPVTVVLIISFVSAYFAILHPNTLVSNMGIYIPLISPFVFVGKILNGVTQIEFLGFVGTEIIFLIVCNFTIMRIFIPKKYY